MTTQNATKAGLKFNLGAGPIWKQDGWYVLDHKLTRSTGNAIAGDAANIDLPDNSCSVVFCSHVFEHIPHYRLPLVLSEINRILEPNGLFRILTPDLERVCRAYVERDENFFKNAKAEDESLRLDLGFGGMLMNFIVSPGQDTILLDRNLKNFIGGYAHVYSYDFQMLDIMMSRLGFKCRRASFYDSEVKQLREPMHVSQLPPVWQNLNQEFYKANNLVHRLVNGKYEINFTVSGFDRDPLTSLIVEAHKEFHIDKSKANAMFNETSDNYNRYGRSLLQYPDITTKLNNFGINY